MKAILAVDEMGGLGYNGKMPWKFGKYKQDAIWFKNHTRNKTVVMGKGTYHSLLNHGPGEVDDFPLKGRHNVVVSSNQYLFKRFYTNAELMTFDKLKEKTDTSEWVVIGGKQLIMSCLESYLIDTFYLSVLPGFHEADIFWPTGEIESTLQTHHFGLIDSIYPSTENSRFRTYKRKYKI